MPPHEPDRKPPHGAAGGGEPRIILHLDMDSFYASVEMQKRPELAGKPVVIGADPKHGKGRGVVSTCSYAAREYGIRSAMPISQAYARCPDAVFLPPDFPAYAAASAQVMAILRSTAFPFEQVSIDEAFLDISAAGSYDAAEALAEELKRAIRAGSGLTCSIGIGPSKIVAKIASDAKKPDGLTVVAPESVPAFLSPLPVRRIPGIGRKAESGLLEAGIRTIGDLAASDVRVLHARFGKGGIAMHERALGIDGSRVEERGGPRSLSRETTFAEDTGDPAVLAATLEELVQDVHRILVDEGLRFRTVTVKVRYTGFVTRTKARSLTHFSGDIATVRKHAQMLLRDLTGDRTVRLVGLRLSWFDGDDGRQMTLSV